MKALPDFIVWLDWSLYAYWPSLMISIALALLHYSFTMPGHWSGLSSLSSTPVLIGAAWWVIACAFRNGYAVG